MKLEQIYTGCLAEAAYYIESEGEAAVIDPLRESSPYLSRAEKNGAKIRYIFETHFHADFVSGHVELAKKSGGTIVYGPTAKTNFDAHIAQDGEEFKVGKLTIKVLHTPGHTPESTCYLLTDETGKQHCLFTGDTLFIGDVGRPDLAQKGDQTMEDMAATLYDSLHSKIMQLPDDLIIYPAHGAGSACGKNMSKETFDSLGHQKETNYALLATSKEQFVKEVTDGILPPPAYFAKNAAMNKAGGAVLEDVFKTGLVGLTPSEFEAAANAGDVLVLDVRDPQVFASGFVPGAINIGLNGQFAPWVGALIPDIQQNILLVTEDGKAEEVITRLARVGYDNTVGYLEGGMTAWKAAGKIVDQIQSIKPAEFAALGDYQDLNVLDVRKPGEYANGHFEFTDHLSLDTINDWTQELNPDETYHIHCAGGYRSMIAASILKARGIDNVIDVAGGYAAIKAEMPQ